MIPEDIRRFVLVSIPSIPYLEAALLIRRKPEVEWSSTAVARALYIAEAAATDLLRALAEAGAVVPTSPNPLVFRYAAQGTPFDVLLQRLADLYRTDMIAITHLVHDATQRNAHRFASAFSIRKGS